MTSSLVVLTGVFALCIACSILLHRRAGSRRSRDTFAEAQRIDTALTLIQLLQKHRGLGAQQDSPAGAQRQQIARDIDQRWRDCASCARELDYLQEQWRDLRQNPADFDGHSLAIKHLLGFIEMLALRSDDSTATARLAFAGHCRALEDLARLRGLSARAARFALCPIELKVPLNYLCQNLRGTDLPCDRDALQRALAEIDERMLDAHHTSISPARCFDLLTPIIDDALTDLRHAMHTLGQVGQARRVTRTVSYPLSGKRRSASIDEPGRGRGQNRHTSPRLSTGYHL